MKYPIFKRAVSALLCAAVLFSAFLMIPLNAKATEPSEGSEISELYKAYALPIKEKADLSDKTLVYSFADELFETENEDFEIANGAFKGLDSIFVNKTAEEALWPVTLYKSFEEAIDLSAFNELYFRAYASEIVEDESIELELTLYSDAESQSISIEFETGLEFDLYFPISNFEYRDNVTEIAVTVNCPEKTSKIVISSFYGDSSFHYSHIPLFTSDSISSETETELFEDRIELTLEEASGSISGKLKNVPKDCRTVCAMITISGADAGTVTLSARNATENEYTSISTLTVNKGKNQYSFVFPSYKGTQSYELSFAGITETENEKLTLHSAVFRYFSQTAFDKTEYVGNLSSCSVMDGGSKIKLNGTIRSSAVVNNLGAKLNVYAASEFDAENILMATVDITTVFEISFETTALKLNPYLYKYYVTISTDSDETIASAPVYPSLPTVNFTSGNSVLGIQSSDSAATFNTNASHAVVDIYLDKLLSTDGKGGRVHSYGGSFRYLSGNYINEIDSRINFLSGSGVNVYLRILMNNGSDDKEAVYVLPDSGNYEECLSYMTMIDFLTLRYSEISGIILGSRVDSLLYSYTEDESLISRTENYAKLLRLTCIAARPNATDAAVIVPFGDGYVYEGDGDGENYVYDPLSGIGEKAADPLIISELIAIMISNYGNFKWHLLYECETNPSEAMNTAYKLAAQLNQGSGTSPSGHMVFWQPEKRISSLEVTDLFDHISKNAISLGTEAVIISFTRHAFDTSIVMSAIENGSLGESSSRTVSKHDSYVLLRPAQNNRCELWDFTRSFSTEGFIFGGSVTSVSTEVSKAMAAFEALESCRCLSATIDKSSQSSGTVLCYFDTPKLLKNATSFDVSINVIAEGDDEIPLKIIIGKGNSRYEYSATVSPSTPSVIRCDTSVMDEKFAAEYVAISIEGQKATGFEITKIAAISKTYDENVLREIMELSKKTDTEITEESKLIIAVVIFVGLTVIIFATLNVRHGGKKNSSKKTPPNN